MDNRKLPISKVEPFADEAKRLGCYTDTQRYNFSTAWKVLTENLGAVGLNLSATIEQLEPKIKEALNERSRNSKVSADSLRVYQARIKRVLDDFVKWNGGDFAKWKEEIAKLSGNDDAKSQKRRKATRQRSNSGGGEGGMEPITHRLIAGDGKEGKISLPTDLSDDQVDKIWSQLEAIKSLIKAQIAPLGAKSK